MLRVNDTWVCRQSANFEGNFRLESTIANTRSLKEHTRGCYSITYEPVDNVAFHFRPHHPIVVTLPRDDIVTGEGAHREGRPPVVPSSERDISCPEAPPSSEEPIAGTSSGTPLRPPRNRDKADKDSHDSEEYHDTEEI